MDAINEENILWCSIHHYIDPIITNADVEKAITDCLAERANIKSNNLFTTEYPTKAPFIARADLDDSSGLNVPPVSLSNVPGTAESIVPLIAETNVPGVSL